jgi:hypothetical protein
MKRHKRPKKLSTRAKATRTPRKKLTQPKIAYATTASAETIAHRTAPIGRAMTSPSELPNPEAAAIGRENVLVGSQAAMATMRRMSGAHRIWSDFWLQQMQRTFTLAPQLAGSQTPARLIQVATDCAGTLMVDCMAFWMKATNFPEAVGDPGNKPIHRTVVGNARRLERAA